MVLLCLGIWLSWRVLKGYSYAAVPGGEGAEGAWAQGRDHRPYAYVRHPTYARVILIGTGVPLLLGSLLVGTARNPVLDGRARLSRGDGGAHANG